ncbi:MAG: outer membrane beta-barrel protein [Bacteroidota bacterium]
MNKLYILLLCMVPFSLQAQSDSKFLIRSNIGYSSGSDFNRFSPDRISDFQFRGLRWNTNAGVNVGKNLMLGLGLDVQRNVSEQNRITNSDPNTGNISVTSIDEFTSTTLTPSIFASLFSNVSEKITLAGDFNIGYAFSDTESTFRSFATTTSGDMNPGSLSNSEVKSETLLFNLAPSVRFKLWKNIGLDFTFGSIRYATNTEDSSLIDSDGNSNNFRVNFTPDSWLLGFFIEL